MDFKKTAALLIDVLGGKENIKLVTHCATRLRVTLVDDSLFDIEKGKKIEGVIDVVVSSSEYQFIIGTQVSSLYRNVNEIIGEIKTESKDERKKVGIFELISASFTPLLSALVAAGMIKAILLILVNLHLVEEASGFARVMSAAGNSVFYFLPVLLGFTISTKLKANPILGAVIGATLLEPNFTAIFTEKINATYLGIPMFQLNYASTIVPIFFAIIAYASLERWLKKVIIQDLQMVFVPTICLFVIVSMTVLVFGPIGSILGNGLTEVMIAIESFSSILFGLVMGSFSVLIIMVGLGWTVVPIILSNLASLGADPILAYSGAMNFAIFGVALGIALKARNKDTKKVALSTFITGVLAGISEPIIYGLLLRYRKTIVYVMIAGGIGGALMGLFSVKGLGFSFNSIFTLSNFSPILWYVFAIVVSFILGFLLVYVLGFNEKDGEVSENH